MEYFKIQPIDYYTSLDALSNAEGEINNALPRAEWFVTFADKEENTLVETIVTYKSLADLETVIQMGLEQGMIATLEKLDELLSSLKNTKIDNTITINATVNAEVKKVWDYYTKSEYITEWNFADPSWFCPSASNDLRKGGKYAARMEARDGSFGFDFETIYDEVTDGQSFSIVLMDGRKVSVSFEPAGDQTEVIVTFDPEKENPIEMQQGGWQSILDNFKACTESK